MPWILEHAVVLCPLVLSICGATRPPRLVRLSVCLSVCLSVIGLMRELFCVSHSGWLLGAQRRRKWTEKRGDGKGRIGCVDARKPSRCRGYCKFPFHTYAPIDKYSRHSPGLSTYSLRALRTPLLTKLCHVIDPYSSIDFPCRSQQYELWRKCASAEFPNALDRSSSHVHIIRHGGIWPRRFVVRWLFVPFCQCTTWVYQYITVKIMW